MNSGSKLLVKSIEETDNSYGKHITKLNIYELIKRGFVVIDKDNGSTSHQNADFICNLLGCDKAGHSGTLDPKVSGVLVIGLGRATRLMEYMLKSDKVYICLMYLHKEVSDENLNQVFKKFTGTIKQTPPIISAVKREERERKIHSLKILDKTNDNKYILFEVSCQHGTYIRKLCSDMADSLKVGGQMIELRRIKAGPFTESDNMISLDKLRNIWELYNEAKNEKEKEILEKELCKYIRPMEELLKEFKKVYVFDNCVDSLSHGHNLAIPGVSKLDDGIQIGEEVAIFSLKGELVAIGESLLTSEDVMNKEKGLFIKTHKTFMDIGVYPKRIISDEK